MRAAGRGSCRQRRRESAPDNDRCHTAALHRRLRRGGRRAGARSVAARTAAGSGRCGCSLSRRCAERLCAHRAERPGDTRDAESGDGAGHLHLAPDADRGGAGNRSRQHCDRGCTAGSGSLRISRRPGGARRHRARSGHGHFAVHHPVLDAVAAGRRHRTGHVAPGRGQALARSGGQLSCRAR